MNTELTCNSLSALQRVYRHWRLACRRATLDQLFLSLSLTLCLLLGCIYIRTCIHACFSPSIVCGGELRRADAGAFNARILWILLFSHFQGLVQRKFSFLLRQMSEITFLSRSQNFILIREMRRVAGNDNGYEEIIRWGISRCYRNSSCLLAYFSPKYI